MGMIKPADKPLEVPLSDIPRKLIVGDKVDWNAVQLALGITDDDRLKEVLLFLYRSDWFVNYYVNTALLKHAVPALATKYTLPADTPPAEEAPWLSADTYCETCPGSEYIKYSDDFTAPRCGLTDRPSRFTECLKYRENLKEAALSPEISEKLYAAAVDSLQEIINVGKRTQETAEGPGHVDQDLGSDSNPATKVVQSLAGGDSHSSSETEAE